MQHERDGGEVGVVSKRAAEIVLALILVGVGAVVMRESLRIGIGWGDDGPQSGYFPFRIGLLIVVSSLATAGIAIFGRAQNREPFVEREQLGRVLKVLAPSAVFVGLIGCAGIYVSTALFIAVFMRWIGKFRWVTVVAVAVLVPVALFLLFEVWFLVPLPKGPLERHLGY